MHTTGSLPTFGALRAAGRTARDTTPRASQANFAPPSDRPAPVDTLARDDAGRVAELLPIRYARMSASPFAFFRGSASIMAGDLQHTPSSGLHVPIAGDAHLSNFGMYASPERRLVFDVNDFDETLSGPWEWDLKRLASSVTIAGRHLGLRRRDIREATLECVRSYAEHMREYAERRTLDVWYAAIDESRLAGLFDRGTSGRRAPSIDAGTALDREHVAPRFVDLEGDEPRIADDHPLLYHPADATAFLAETRDLLDRYARTLPPERRTLFDRFRLVDAANKVVGVGSVGTRCSVALLMSGPRDPLVLQIKEARASVYEAYGHRSPYAEHGERVVIGQRLLQGRSDIFLGWAKSPDGASFYVRQLADRKSSIDVDQLSASDLVRYASLCAWALARAHARAGGQASWIAAYLGRGDAFAGALDDFADRYADQNEKDFESLLAAIESGRVIAHPHPT